MLIMLYKILLVLALVIVLVLVDFTIRYLIAKQYETFK